MKTRASLSQFIVSAILAACSETTPQPVTCGTTTEVACCCQGDVQETPVCSASGLTCGTGYGLYRGDMCRCLPDRDTPCCLPHVFPDAGRDVVTDTSADTATDTSADASSTPCPGGTACHPFRVTGTHGGACPSVVFFGTACSDRCLACNPTGPDGGPGFGTGDPCVCDGTRWVCPSDSALTCALNTTCWLAGPPPACN